MAYYGAQRHKTVLRGVDKEYIEAVNRRQIVIKNVLAVYPCMVDLINMYYKREWMTERRFIELRNRYGKACKLLKIRKVRQ